LFALRVHGDRSVWGKARCLARAEALDALHADLNDMRAELAALREGGEKAAQQRQDAARTAEAVLERIERAVRRVPWWRRIFGG